MSDRIAAALVIVAWSLLIIGVVGLLFLISTAADKMVL